MSSTEELSVITDRVREQTTKQLIVVDESSGVAFASAISTWDGTINESVVLPPLMLAQIKQDASGSPDIFIVRLQGRTVIVGKALADTNQPSSSVETSQDDSCSRAPVLDTESEGCSCSAACNSSSS